MPELEAIDIADLHMCINDGRWELRRDLHVFVNYVLGSEVKRTVRGNTLSKSDFMKLAKLVSHTGAVEEVKSSGNSGWIEYIDKLALKMGFVTYDTKGIYVGYTSSEPSFPDNYIKVDAAEYKQFLESSAAAQEKVMLKVLLGDYTDCNNEFFSKSILGRLDSFDRRGCATGVVPMLNFASIRRFLLEILALCESGTWYSVDSLIRYMKQSHPFFLIPKNFKIKNKYDLSRRYGNFSERKGKEWKYDPIKEQEPDCFERVEGRFLERFLESLPLVMGYLNTAYNETYTPDLHPSLGHIRAFCVRDRLVRVMKDAVTPPKVWIQPNFEIYIESDLYPASILSKLAPLTDVVKEDQIIILKLSKEKVAAAATQDKAPDVVLLLQSLSEKELPRNVLTELNAWNSHAELITLYEGFGLLEASEILPEADKFIAERISSDISLVRSPDKLFAILEDVGRVPLQADHHNIALARMPEGACIIFRRKATATPPRLKKKAVLKCRTNIDHYFPSEELYELFVRKLVEAKCPCVVNKPALSITVSHKSAILMKEIIEGVKKEYQITIEDME